MPQVRYFCEGALCLFGYVRIDKNELKVKDYNLFKACYCGVCQTLKKEYGFPARYFLSYDTTFLAVLLTALREDEPTLCPGHCMANPFVRRPMEKTNEALSYAAAVNVLLVWFKLADDLHDNRSLRALLLMPWMRGKRNRARRRYPQLYQAIAAQLAELAQLEKAQCAEADAPAAAFGRLMAKIFEADGLTDAETRRVLAHMGFLTGRFIYLLDAWEDRAEDGKKGCYNPFLAGKASAVADDVKLSLDYTLSQLAASCELLPLRRCQAIIENIIYLGMRQSLDRVFTEKSAAACGEKEKHHERPL